MVAGARVTLPGLPGPNPHRLRPCLWYNRGAADRSRPAYGRAARLPAPSEDTRDPRRGRARAPSPVFKAPFAC